jgi:hypothetical protein
MAIAPLLEQGQFDLYEDPWPRADLRVVSPPAPTHLRLHGPEPIVYRLEATKSRPAAHRIHAESPNRRRRFLMAAIAVMALVALATPLTALGGVTVTGQQTPGGLPSGLIPGEPYTVRSGDTIASIASRLGAPSAQAQIQTQLRAEVGSNVLVAGEQIVLP